MEFLVFSLSLFVHEWQYFECELAGIVGWDVTSINIHLLHLSRNQVEGLVPETSYNPL